MDTSNSTTIKKTLQYLKVESTAETEDMMKGEFIKILKEHLFDPMRKLQSGLNMHARRLEWFGQLHYHCFYLGDLMDLIQKKFNILESEAFLIVKIMSKMNWIEPIVVISSFDFLWNLFTGYDSSKIDRNQVYKLSVKPRLVIVGGGHAGYCVCKDRIVRDMYDVTIIDPNSTCYMVPAFPLLVKDKELIEHISVSHEKTLPRAKCIAGKVSNIDSSKVHYEVKDKGTATESVEFDFVLVSTGCTCRFNNSCLLENNQVKFINCYNAQSIIDSHEFIRNSKLKDICIVGGGFAGCEVAGFLAEKYPDMTIHIIQRSERIMKPSEEATSKKVCEIFESMGNIKIHTWSQIVSQPNSTTLRIQNSQTNEFTDIECDVCFLGSGMKPQSDMLTGNYSNCLDSTGQIKVNNHFQILDQDEEPIKNMFAIGDVANVKETKLVSCAIYHSIKVCQVLQHYVHQSSIESVNQIKPYTPRGYEQTQKIIIGSNNGVWLSGKKLLFSSSFVAWIVEKSIHFHAQRMMKDTN